MSDTESARLVERFISAFNDKDTEAMQALLADDVVHDPREGTREIGKETFHWHVGQVARHFHEQWTDVAIMTAPGGVRAAAEFTLAGSYHATRDDLPAANGQSYRVPAGMFFEIDDGLITRLTTYVDMAAWRAALNK